MSTWKQILIYQGVSILQSIVGTYGDKYFTMPELAAFNTAIGVLNSLPARVKGK